MLCNVVAGKAVLTGAVAGGITLNPGVIAGLTAFGAVVKIVATAKKYDKKAIKAGFARVEYKKILDATRFHLRGEPLDAKEFLDKVKMVDDFVSDHCMEIPESFRRNTPNVSPQVFQTFLSPCASSLGQFLQKWLRVVQEFLYCATKLLLELFESNRGKNKRN